jgi:hypothetical protein
MLSIPYLEVEDVKPDTWKAHLHRSFLTFFQPGCESANNHHSGRSPLGRPFIFGTVAFFAGKINLPGTFPMRIPATSQSLFDNQIEAMGELYQEVKLKDLSLRKRN